MTYISSSLFILLLIPWNKVFIDFPRRILRCYSPLQDTTEGENVIAVDHLQHIRIAAMIAPVWFASNWAYDMSLQLTTISSSTVLASTGSLFTFLFAILSKEETFTKPKFAGVILCMLGSILTTIHDYDSDSPNNNSNNGSRSMLGDIAGLGAAIGYGTYTVLIRKTCHSKEEGSSHSSYCDDTNSAVNTSPPPTTINMALMFGYIGAWLMLALGPVILVQLFILHSSSVPSLTEFKWIVMNGILDNVISDYLWARAVILTSATVATVGVGLTIPMAFIADFFILKKNINDFNSLLGALAVLIGFLLVNVSTQDVPTTTEYEAVQEDLADDNELQLQTQHGERKGFATNPS